MKVENEMTLPNKERKTQGSCFQKNKQQHSHVFQTLANI